MWLLPPDFSTDAFDLPPGTWALPWYADEQHITTLMRLLVAGEVRIREWLPLPWAMLDHVDIDTPVRPGAALVLYAPSESTKEEIEARARVLPWPYVFWYSPHPAIEGEGAWLEREIKRALLSELHRSLLDPGHPLARFHVERLPLDLLASMVADPVDLLEIAQASIIHRLHHEREGLRKQDFEHSVRWAAGRRLGEYLWRIPEEHRVGAAAIAYLGRRGRVGRASFQQAAKAMQDVGLGLLVAEDLALGPLARSADDDTVWMGASIRLAEHGFEPSLLERMSVPALAEQTSEATRISASTASPLIEALQLRSVRRSVWLDPSVLGIAELIPKLRQSPHLRLVDTRAAAYFRVSLAAEHLHVAGPPWLRRVPWPATPLGIDALLEDLQALAQSDILLAALESPPGLGMVRWEAKVFVMEPGAKTRLLRPGEILREGDRMFAELQYSGREISTLYANVLDQRITGRLGLVNRSEPTGLPLHALETVWVGRRQHGSPSGMMLTWPSTVPRDAVGHEALIFVLSNRPIDFRSLLTGPATERKQSKLRGDPWLWDGEPTPLLWAIERVEFGLQPEALGAVSPAPSRP